MTRKSVQEHLSTLEEVLLRIMESELRLRKDKCVFLARSVVYLGHQIDSEGLHPSQKKSKQSRKHQLQRMSQETLPTVGQESENVTPLPESAMTHRYPSRTRKTDIYIELSCTVFILGREECSDVTVLFCI